MESSESNQLEAGPVLCRAGCGFFGSRNTEEFCSKCYKDQQKKKQQSTNSSSTPATPPPTLASSRTSTPPPPHSPAKDLAEVVATSLAQDKTRDELPEASSSTQDDLEDSGSDKELGKKKKNKCASCKKKLGLTGFTCRCGGLYCGVHRYSDKHECSFDYRQLGAQEIRANNPVIKGEKIQKI